ncbi:MAG: SDR family NAD(P)-dependent oxidoreductase [Dehalococcoidia bacterium]
MDINGKVALITGGGSGIGRATALRLAKEGASVVVADVDDDGGKETVRQIEIAAGRASYVRADVADEADARAMVAFAEETFGGLDILHNNAGIITRRPRFPDAETESWYRTLDVNLRGVIIGTQYGIRSMRKRGGGVIINTASMAGLAGWPGDPIYSASKGGVVLFTASLALLKDEANIRVNCVCPGVVDTPLLRKASEDAADEQRRVAEALERFPVLSPDDIADAVVELIHDDTLAGRAMRILNGRPRELSNYPPPAGGPGGLG